MRSRQRRRPSRLAETLRNEFVVEVTGKVRERPAGTVNPNLVSGEVEVLAAEIEILNPSLTPPFLMDDDTLSENVRLEYRFLDLRRPQMQKNLRLRYKTAMAVRVVPRPARLYRHRDADADALDARRRARLPGAEPRASRASFSRCRSRRSCSSSC